MHCLKLIGPASLALLPLGAFAEGTLERQMLSHVEKILVVDSINVDRNEFFRRYRLQPSTGSVISGAEVKSMLGNARRNANFVGDPFTGFTNEFKDYMIWAQEDTTGYLRLAESVQLADGSWSPPAFTSPTLNFGEEADDDEPVEANAAFPFMLDDGQTLYFAADNAFSLGGYDIFVATKDPSDGSFLIPGNLGMPFNSPYDDYMMVLDRQTGVGWWASDRNQLEDEVTVYIYALPDERVNVDPADENLMTYATLQGWRSLLDDEAIEAAGRLKREIEAIREVERRVPDFSLPMPGGKTYRFFSDFKSRKAAELMKRYLRDSAALEEDERQLSSLRADYYKSGSSRQLAPQIQKLEQKVRNQRRQLNALLSDVYREEGR